MECPTSCLLVKIFEIVHKFIDNENAFELDPGSSANLIIASSTAVTVNNSPTRGHNVNIALYDFHPFHNENVEIKEISML